MVDCQKLQRKVQRVYGRGIHIKEQEGNVVLSGTLDSWEDIVNAEDDLSGIIGDLFCL